MQQPDLKRLVICSCVGITIIGIILLLVLLPVSIKVVSNDEIALRYHTISKEFDRNQTPYTQGRYVLTPGEKFFTFKRVYQLETFEGDNSINCVTSDGLVLDLDVTYQYRLQSKNLVRMFSLLDADYLDVIRSQTKAAIRDGCGNWTSVQFYYSRQAVQDDMNTRVDQRLETVFCDGGFLQLVNVRFDENFSESISDTQVAIQDIAQAENERAQALIQAQTILLQAQQTAEITIQNARASAQSIIQIANYDAMSINATINSQREAYLQISQALGLTGKDLINYISIQTMENMKELTLGVDSPAAFSFK